MTAMKRAWFYLLLVSLAIPSTGCLAAPFTNFAGNGVSGYNGDDGPAINARLNEPFGLLRGPDGALWFCDYAAQVVRRVAPDGTITTVAGTGRAGHDGDNGPATRATLNAPHEIRFDRAGNLFIADTSNHAIRRLDTKTGLITTFVGTGKAGYMGDSGPADRAQLKLPISIQFSSAGDLFIADIGNHVIRRIDAKTKIITTFAGIGKAGATPDGSPIAGTPLNGPRSLDFDARGDLWLVTREGNQLLRFDLAKGLIRHEAGTGAKGFAGDGGPAKTARLSGPKGIAMAPNWDVYLADTENNAIRKLDRQRGILERVAGLGMGKRGNDAPGEPLQTGLARPHGLWVSPEGTLFVSDTENHRILVLPPVKP
jgi:streptogramin lyase